MSIQTQIERLKTNVSSAYSVVQEMGGTIPENATSDNLPGAIRSIQSTGTSDNFPSGGIIIWSGGAAAVPDGWALCDGTNGTPDLRDRFVLGAGSSHRVGETGGSEEVTLTINQLAKHNHIQYLGSKTSQSNSPWRSNLADGTGQVGKTLLDSSMSGYLQCSNSYSVSTGIVGANEPHPNMPPYYTLCYIMKL